MKRMVKKNEVVIDDDDARSSFAAAAQLPPGVFMSTRSKRRPRRHEDSLSPFNVATERRDAMYWSPNDMPTPPLSPRQSKRARRRGLYEAVCDGDLSGIEYPDVPIEVDLHVAEEYAPFARGRRRRCSEQPESVLRESVLPLTIAAYGGRIGCMCLLQAMGASLNSEVSHSAAMAACVSGQVDALYFLLDQGNYDLNVGEPTILKAACYKNQVSCARVLLKYGASPNAAERGHRTPLQIASCTDSVDMMAVLIDAGADIDVEEDFGGQSPLHLACMHGSYRAAELLLDVGARIDTQGRDGNLPMHLATSFNHVEIMRLLLELDVEPRRRLDDEEDRPLERALSKLPTASILEGNVSATDRRTRRLRRRECRRRRNERRNAAEADDVYANGVSLLYGACDDGSLATAKLLIEHGANVHRNAPGGYTPIYIAAHRGNVDCVRLLVENGADLDVRTSYGETPLFVAARFGHLETIAFLLERGCKVNCEALPKGDPLKRVHLGGSPMQVAWLKHKFEAVSIIRRHNSDIRAAANDPGKLPLYLVAKSGFLSPDDLNFIKDEHY